MHRRSKKLSIGEEEEKEVKPYGKNCPSPHPDY
jgi:hypothetical protein